MSKSFFKFISLIYFLFIAFQVGSFLIVNHPGSPVRASENLPSWSPPNLQVNIGDVNFKEPTQCGTANGKPVYCVWWIKDIIQAYYGFAVGAVGIIAAVGMMIGGLLWLTAGGAQQQVGKAKEWIKGSLIGLLLVMFTYTLLYTINPELINLRAVMVTVVDPKKLELDLADIVVSGDSNPSLYLSATNMSIADFKNIKFSERAKKDIEDGKLHPNAMALLAAIEKAGIKVDVSCIMTGHNKYVRDKYGNDTNRISDHYNDGKQSMALDLVGSDAELSKVADFLSKNYKDSIGQLIFQSKNGNDSWNLNYGNYLDYGAATKAAHGTHAHLSARR